MIIGIDKIDIDDESFLMGVFRRSKSFLNVKNYRSIKMSIDYLVLFDENTGKPLNTPLFMFDGDINKAYDYVRHSAATKGLENTCAKNTHVVYY